MKKFFKETITYILQKEAKLVLRKYNPKIVAVTGSVGKTSTKDAIYTVLASAYHVRKSEKSFNSELGIPLTILGCDTGWGNPFIWLENIFHGLFLIVFTQKYPKWLILEVGADRPGDIKKVTNWLHPDIVVITRFGKVPVHVEFFNSREEVIREKSYLAHALKQKGSLILNCDDEDVLALKEATKRKTFTYGFDGRADIVASHYGVDYENYEGVTLPSGISFKMNYGNNSLPTHIKGVLGIQQVYPLAAAFAVGYSEEINPVSMNDVLNNHITPNGRMKLVSGIKKTMIIDDGYNASPIAMEEAVLTLKSLNVSGKKIAVFGDMLEIGKYSTEAHKEIGMLASDSANILFTVGLRARSIAEGALDNGMDEKNIYQFDNSREAGKFLEQMLGAGDVVLVKGSQGMRMERVVEEVMEHPEDKEKLLVRQEKEWQRKK
ncbi:MAG: Mur ligase family protein [Candidatus Paceibacterota bacterium]